MNQLQSIIALLLVTNILTIAIAINNNSLYQEERRKHKVTKVKYNYTLQDKIQLKHRCNLNQKFIEELKKRS